MCVSSKLPSSSEQIRTMLERLEVRKNEVPVFASTDGYTMQHLGFAGDHMDADLLGLVCRITSAKVSRGSVPGSTRTFFILH